MKLKLNTEFQFYKGLPLQLIHRSDYSMKQAKRFAINGTNQNVWIPNKHLLPNGTIMEDQDLNYVFAPAGKKLELAGYMMGFIPIKQPERQRFKPPVQRMPAFDPEEESSHPEIRNMSDYFMHYAHEPY